MEDQDLDITILLIQLDRYVEHYENNMVVAYGDALRLKEEMGLYAAAKAYLEKHK